MIIAGTTLAFLLVVVVIIPYLALESARRLGPGRLWISRERLFAQVIVTQAILFAIAWLTARQNHIELWRSPRSIAWLCAVVVLAAALVMLKLRWSSRPPASKARLTSMVPQNGRERWPYAGVCIAAGIAEEVVYRGVLTSLLAAYVPLTVAAIISAMVFGIAHAIQGPRAVIATAAIAIALQALVAVGDSLVPAMAVHAVYDYVAGLLVPRWYARDRATSPPIVAAPASNR